MPRDEIAKAVGVSVSSLKRAFRGTRICYFNKYVANQNLTLRVCRYYEKNGMPETVKAFPGVKVDVIVETYGYRKGLIKNKRQVRWTDKQIADLARMGGLISHKAQAKYFNRPRAFEGSIKSAWTKKFGFMAGEINGMKHNQARHLVTKRCPFVRIRISETRDNPAYDRRRVYLWVDMEKHLRSNCPEFIREAIVTMAQFQRWLHQSNQPQRKIRAMIRRLET